MPMAIPTEPIGSIPRPLERFEATGSPVITNKPVEQAVISPSALSLMYPDEVLGTALASERLGLG